MRKDDPGICKIPEVNHQTFEDKSFAKFRFQFRFFSKCIITTLLR